MKLFEYRSDMVELFRSGYDPSGRTLCTLKKMKMCIWDTIQQGITIIKFLLNNSMNNSRTWLVGKILSDMTNLPETEVN